MTVAFAPAFAVALAVPGSGGHGAAVPGALGGGGAAPGVGVDDADGGVCTNGVAIAGGLSRRGHGKGHWSRENERENRAKEKLAEKNLKQWVWIV